MVDVQDLTKTGTDRAISYSREDFFWSVPGKSVRVSEKKGAPRDAPLS